MPDSSTTAISFCSGVEIMAMRAGAIISRIMNSGVSIVEMMKLLRLTRSRYSRVMIIERGEFIAVVTG